MEEREKEKVLDVYAEKKPFFICFMTKLVTGCMGFFVGYFGSNGIFIPDPIG
jgi:hypothetical protein